MKACSVLEKPHSGKSFCLRKAFFFSECLPDIIVAKQQLANNRSVMHTLLDTSAPSYKKVHKLKISNRCVSYVTILIRIFADDLDGFLDVLNSFYA